MITEDKNIMCNSQVGKIKSVICKAVVEEPSKQKVHPFKKFIPKRKSK